MQLAAELMDVRNDQELQHFLGSLISKVGAASRTSQTHQSARHWAVFSRRRPRPALPIAGSALGTFIGGPAGGNARGKLASAAGNMFGLELKGLSGEDKEFETARRFVRFAGHAAQHNPPITPRCQPARGGPLGDHQGRAAARSRTLAEVGAGRAGARPAMGPHGATHGGRRPSPHGPAVPFDAFQAITAGRWQRVRGRTRRQTTRALTRPTGTATTPAIRA